MGTERFMGWLREVMRPSSTAIFRAAAMVVVMGVHTKAEDDEYRYTRLETPDFRIELKDMRGVIYAYERNKEVRTVTITLPSGLVVFQGDYWTAKIYHDGYWSTVLLDQGAKLAAEQDRLLTESFRRNHAPLDE